jgi:hypothetical protein
MRWMVKVDWLAACIALRVVGVVQYWSFSSGVGVKFAQSSIQWEAETEEMSQTLLTNKKQGKVDTLLTLLSQFKLALTARNTLFVL